MPLKNIFKTKKSSKKEDKKDKKETKKKKVVKKVEKKEKKVVKKAVKPTPKKTVKGKKTAFEGFAYRILKFPHITEKATILSENDQYVFVIYNNVNKIEVRKAVEALYDVNVLSVQIIKMPKKKRRVGKVSGWRKGYKKAVVRIKKGQKIEDLIS